MHVRRIPKGRSWYVQWKDHRGKSHRWAAGPDKRAAEQYGRRLETLVACRVAGARISPDDREWIARLPRKRRMELAALGLAPASNDPGENVLTDYLEQYERWQLVKGVTASHARWTKRAIERTLIGVAATVPEHVKTIPLVEYLSKHCKSARTWNSYRVAMKGFFGWMVRYKHLDESPLGYVPIKNEQADRKRERREYTDAEIDALLTVTEASETRCGMPGPARAMLYRLALETGFRYNEIAQLTIAMCKLGGPEPSITVPAAYSKRRRRDEQPIRPEFAKALKTHVKGLPSDAPLFVLPRRWQVSKMLQEDLAAAGVAYRDEQRRVADFHAMRHTFVSRIGRSAESLADLQALSRLSTLSLVTRYAHPRLVSMRSALAGLEIKPAKKRGRTTA